MPDTDLLTPPQENIKKPKQSARGGKTVSKKKTDKSPFKFNVNLNASPVLPKAELKAMENLPAVKKNEAKNIYFKIALSFVALTVILVLAVMYFSFSKVTLTIVPTQEKITDSLSLGIVNQGAGETVISRGQVQGIVRQMPVEQSRTFTASGKEILGQEVTGQVTVINNYMKNQPLVASTRLLGPDNKLFRLKNTVNVPAGGKVEALVYADEAKPDMAIGPSKFTVPGLWAGLQDKIYGQSSQPMKYAEKVKYIITQSDIDQAVSDLKKDLLANATKEVNLAIEEYDQSIIEVDNNSINQEVFGKVGEEKEKFSIKMKTKVTAVAFKGDDVYGQVQDKLAATLADDKEIVEFSQSDMTYSLANSDLKQGTATVNVNFTAKVTLKNSTGIINKNKLTGLTEQRLKAYLNGLPEVAGYEIKFFPSFVRKTPNLVDRIEIVIKK